MLDLDRKMKWCARAWVMEPMDALLARLQWLDDKTEALHECLYQESSPFEHCTQRLHGMLAEPCTSGPLAVLHDRFSSEGLGASFTSTAMQLVLTLIGEVELLSQFLEKMLFGLFKMADPRLDNAGRLEIAQALDERLMKIGMSGRHGVVLPAPLAAAALSCALAC